MPTISKALFRGAATTTVSTILYTVPALTTSVCTNIIVTNTSSVLSNFTLGLGGTNLATTVSISGFDSTVIDIKQVLIAGQTITGGANVAAINFHISGVEISA
jgi:hypothetical protein